jgi:hypothetical protein
VPFVALSRRDLFPRVRACVRARACAYFLPLSLSPVALPRASRRYLEQTANFIVQNAGEAAMGAAVRNADPFTAAGAYVPPPPGAGGGGNGGGGGPVTNVDPLTATGAYRPTYQQQPRAAPVEDPLSANRYRPGMAAAAAAPPPTASRSVGGAHFPARAAVAFDAMAKPEVVVAKLAELSAQLGAQGCADALDADELRDLGALASALAAGPAGAAGAASVRALDALAKAARWPAASAFPALDVLRLALLLPAGAARAAAMAPPLVPALLRALAPATSAPAATVVMALRCLCNMCAVGALHAAVGEHATAVLEAASEHLNGEAANAQARTAAATVRATRERARARARAGEGERSSGEDVACDGGHAHALSCTARAAPRPLSQARANSRVLHRSTHPIPSHLRVAACAPPPIRPPAARPPVAQLLLNVGVFVSQSAAPEEEAQAQILSALASALATAAAAGGAAAAAEEEVGAARSALAVRSQRISCVTRHARARAHRARADAGSEGERQRDRPIEKARERESPPSERELGRAAPSAYPADAHALLPRALTGLTAPRSPPPCCAPAARASRSPTGCSWRWARSAARSTARPSCASSPPTSASTRRSPRSRRRAARACARARARWARRSASASCAGSGGRARREGACPACRLPLAARPSAFRFRGRMGGVAARGRRQLATTAGASRLVTSQSFV